MKKITHWMVLFYFVLLVLFIAGSSFFVKAKVEKNLKEKIEQQNSLPIPS